MADDNYTVFDPQSSKRIADAVRKVERQFQAVISRLAELSNMRTKWTVCGKLTSSLARSGKGKFKFYTPAGLATPASGGLEASPQSDTEYDIYDIGMLSSTINSGTTVVAAWAGVWVIIAYDCGT